MKHEEATVIIAAIMLSLFGAFIYVWWNSYVCFNKAELMHKRAHYGITTGCMIEHKPNEWIPIQQYRVID